MKFVVDSVSDLLRLAAEHIKPAPQFSSAIDGGFITGIGNIQERMMILMDIEALMRSAYMGLDRDLTKRLGASNSPRR